MTEFNLEVMAINIDKILEKAQVDTQIVVRIHMEIENVKKELREKFASFADVMASCRNDFFLEDFYEKTLEWLNNAEKEILGKRR